MTKALVMFSGGLDSRLTIKLLQEQRIEVEAIYVKLPFGKGCSQKSEEIIQFAKEQKTKLHQIDASKGKLFKEYLKIIKDPKFNRGAGFNPCKDCKIFIFKQAKKLAKEIKANIIATGEVLGQRPMSQMKSSLLLDEKEAGLENKILRPLSAKLLPETIYEKENLIDREKLLDLHGRRREKQIALAKKYKIPFTEPAGGCILCEKLLKGRFKLLLNRSLTEEQAKLVSIGRQFLIKDTWIILGRNHEENILLENLKEGIFTKPLSPGPCTLHFGKISKETINNLIKTYSKNGTEKQKKEFERYKI